jgi:hypothetical protein
MPQPSSLPRVTTVEPLDGFVLRLTFTDGLIREVDLTFDDIGVRTGSTWADVGGRQARPGVG